MSRLMKACVLEDIGRLVYKEVPMPEPREGEVLLKVRAAGICGSDIDRVFKKGTKTMPMVPGHEIAGEIVSVGPGAAPALAGKKAAVFPLLPCRACDMCEVGEYGSCRNYDYFGSRRDGGFAEYLAVPVWNLVIPESGLSFEELAMVEPAAVSLHALGKAGVELMDTVAVFGAGAIGLMLSEFATAQGAGDVILLDIDPAKLDFARKLGYTHAVDSSKAGYVDEVMDITKGKGVDLAVEGAGASASLAGCLSIVKPMGNVVLMGNPSGDINMTQKVYWEILRKQLTVKGTWNSSYTRNKNDWEVALKAMARGRLDVAKFITHRFPFEKCAEAFDAVRDKNEFSNRVMFVNK